MSLCDINSNSLNENCKKVNEFAKSFKKPQNGSNEITVLESVFIEACKAIQNLPKNGLDFVPVTCSAIDKTLIFRIAFKGSLQLSNELLLKFYGYYKQAVDGPCTRPKPSMFKMVEKAKWDSWNSMRDLTRTVAMNSYNPILKYLSYLDYQDGATQ